MNSLMARQKLYRFGIRLSILLIPVLLFSSSCNNTGNPFRLDSPLGNLSIRFSVTEDSLLIYRLECQGTKVVEDSRLGILREDSDFSTGLVLDSVSGPRPFLEDYELIAGKSKNIRHNSNRCVLHLHNREGKPMRVEFMASDDGAGFRYIFPGTSEEALQIEAEITEYRFPAGTRAFIQPMAKAKSGWCRTNPSYEEYYEIDVPLDSLPEHPPGWVLPALFRTGENWVLISEAGVNRNYCGTRLEHRPGENRLSTGFPPEAENFPGGEVKPRHSLPWITPWRILAAGDLGTLVESNLGTDLADPPSGSESALAGDPDKYSWIQPGRASWSWVLLKDNSIVTPVQKRFIDYASDMGWEYCLIDVDWDQKIGYARIKELAEYAAGRNVGLILWYNSSGDWNTTVYTPKSMLLTPEDRRKEFTRLRDMGIRGIKVDFFGGDGSSMMDYYLDIFEDAAGFGLLVNCHGATLPRGWQRTCPNLLTMEAVRGFEFVTFEQANADQQPSHCCILPFTRNVFDPMDFTPVCFSEVPRIHRLTSNGFELALSVLFWSGLQHYAEIPEGMSRVPGYVKEFMKEVPCTWDDVHFLSGEPGKLVILARRSGKTWYVAGINGEGREKKVRVPFDFLKAGGSGILIGDGKDQRSFRMEELEISEALSLDLTLMAYGGFVLRIRPLE